MNPILDPNSIQSDRPASSPAYGAMRDAGWITVLTTLAAKAAAGAISDGGSDQVGSAVGQLIEAVGPMVLGLAAGAITGLFTYTRKKIADWRAKNAS